MKTTSKCWKWKYAANVKPREDMILQHINNDTTPRNKHPASKLAKQDYQITPEKGEQWRWTETSMPHFFRKHSTPHRQLSFQVLQPRCEKWTFHNTKTQKDMYKLPTPYFFPLSIKRFRCSILQNTKSPKRDNIKQATSDKSQTKLWFIQPDVRGKGGGKSSSYFQHRSQTSQRGLTNIFFFSSPPKEM